MRLHEFEIAVKAGIAYLPLGTVEWHERHLPLGTDGLVAWEVCKAACKRTGGCVIPPLYLGTSTSEVRGGKKLIGMERVAGTELPGGLYYLEPDVFYKVIESVASNAERQGFRRLVIVSGHLGVEQVKALERLVSDWKGKIKIAFHGRGIWGEGGHAGIGETSIMLALHEELVAMDKLPGPYKGILETSPWGANKTLGKKIIADAVEKIVKMAS